ncbi:hypothetical protein RHSIM_Rhsim05G0045200 [Rhododendron simsii]|uniref:Uncharacterized protein n=1 Tax=Rhododendron simsii TaxID=118357 RepID=A0A834LMC9_RHOSS|nr:hypothetical protein RHSIM_Rhsim05G0045200 [Rhododendron simsii]
MLFEVRGSFQVKSMLTVAVKCTVMVVGRNLLALERKGDPTLQRSFGRYHQVQECAYGGREVQFDGWFVPRWWLAIDEHFCQVLGDIIRFKSVLMVAVKFNLMVVR